MNNTNCIKYNHSRHCGFCECCIDCLDCQTDQISELEHEPETLAALQDHSRTDWLCTECVSRVLREIELTGQCYTIERWLR